MFRQKKCGWVIVAAAVVCLALAWPAPGLAAEKAEKKVDIVISGLYDLTGPYSGVHQLFVKAAKDYVTWANQEGVCPGANIVVDVVDIAADANKTVVAFQRAASKKPRAVISTGGFASHCTVACMQLAKRLKIPIISGSSARSIVTPPGWTFSIQGCYEGMVGCAGDWVIANWKPDSQDAWIRKHYEDRKPRLAIIGWDNTFGRAFDQPETRAYLKKIGVDFVGAEYIPMSPADTSAQLIRLVKEKKADFLYLGMYPSSHAVILKDAARLGLRDKFQDFSFWASSIEQVQTQVKELAERSMEITGYKMLVSEWEIPYMVEAFKKSKLPPVYGTYYAAAAAYFDLYTEAIRRAAAKVGPGKVDGAAVYQALITMKSYKPRLYNSTCSYSKTKMVGPDTATMYQIQGGKVVNLANDLHVPDLLPGGKDVPK